MLTIMLCFIKFSVINVLYTIHLPVKIHSFEIESQDINISLICKDHICVYTIRQKFQQTFSHQ